MPVGYLRSHNEILSDAPAVVKRKQLHLARLSMHLIIIDPSVFTFGTAYDIVYQDGTKGGDMAEKKAMCAGKTKQGTPCKKPATGKSKFCATHKKK